MRRAPSVLLLAVLVLPFVASQSCLCSMCDADCPGSYLNTPSVTTLALGESDSFRSASGESSYNGCNLCHWRYTTTPDLRLRIEITRADLDDFSESDQDHIVLLDGPDESQSVMLDAQPHSVADLPQTVYETSTSTLTAVLATDTVFSDTGLRATVTAFAPSPGSGDDDDNNQTGPGTPSGNLSGGQVAMITVLSVLGVAGIVGAGFLVQHHKRTGSWPWAGSLGDGSSGADSPGAGAGVTSAKKQEAGKVTRAATSAAGAKPMRKDSRAAARKASASTKRAAAMEKARERKQPMDKARERKQSTSKHPEAKASTAAAVLTARRKASAGANATPRKRSRAAAGARDKSGRGSPKRQASPTRVVRIAERVEEPRPPIESSSAVPPPAAASVIGTNAVAPGDVFVTELPVTGDIDAISVATATFDAGLDGHHVPH